MISSTTQLSFFVILAILILKFIASYLCETLLNYYSYVLLAICIVMYYYYYAVYKLLYKIILIRCIKCIEHIP
jgi:hypothetical protein